MKRDEANRRIQALVEFHEAIGALLEMSQIAQGGGAQVVMRGPLPGRQSEWAGARARVDQLAVKAGRSFEAAGIWVDHKPPGTWETQPVNPALLWQVCFEPDAWFPLAMLEQLTNRAIGRLEDLRDDPPASTRRVSVGGFSIVGWLAALLYTALGGLIAMGLAYWLGWVG